MAYHGKIFLAVSIASHFMFVLAQNHDALHQSSFANIVVYDEDLQTPWFHIVNDASVTFKSTEQVLAGQYSMKISAAPWGWVSMHYGPWNTAGFSPEPFQYVEFAIYPTTAATSVAVFLENDQGESFPKIPKGTFMPNRWTTVSVPISELNPNRHMINRIFLQEFSGTTKTIYIDNFRFAGANLSVPILSDPRDGSTGISADPVLAWNASDDASSYQLQVSVSASFQNTSVDLSGIASTSVGINDLTANTKYYWRVRGNSSDDTSDWSSVWNFTTRPASLSAPILIFPSDGSAGHPTPLTFRWNSPPGSQFCRLQVSTTASFSTIILDDSSITGTSRLLDSLLPNVQYFWRVSAQNADGRSLWSPIWSFTTAAASPGTPQLVFPADGSTNQPTTILFSWMDVPSAEMYRLQIATNPSFTPTTIDDSLITSTSKEIRGIPGQTQFYWRVNAGTTTSVSEWSAPWSFTTAESTSSPLLTLRKTIQFPEGEYTEKDYKLVGIPGSSNLPIASSMLGAPSKDWQVYWDNGTPENYLIPYNGRSEFAFSTGKAFWMIKRGNWNLNAEVPPPLQNINGETEILLHRGWNLITNPFLEPIEWNGIQTYNSIGEQIFAYDRGTFIIADSLRPFTGYYFFNAESLTVLRIPADDNSNPGLIISAKDTPSGNEEWRVNVVLKNGASLDNTLWFGCEDDAKKELDDHDFHKPRGIGSAPGTYFYRARWNESYPRFASDIRPPFTEIEQWDFDVCTLPNTTAEISFAGIETIPVQFDAYLLCKSQGTFVDLRSSDSYKFLASEKSSSFAIVVGPHGSLEQILADQGNPNSATLGANYPNPFNASTTIPVELSERSHLRASIYNLIGQESARLFEGTLDAGYHRMIWKGSDGQGKNLPSGVYFCRLVVDDNHVYTRRMILTK